MNRIIKLVENELARQEDEITLLKWEKQELEKSLKEAQATIEEMRRRLPFDEAIRIGE